MLQEQQTAVINNANAHSIFIVFAGTWTNSSCYLMFPKNGSSIAVKEIANSGQTAFISVAPNGSWGISITNTVTYEIPLVVLKTKAL